MRTFAADDAVAALTDPRLAVVRYRENQQALAERLGLDLSAITSALNGIPLALRGSRHGTMRAVAAQLIAERRSAALRALPGIVERRFGRLREPGACDLVAEVIAPCVDEVLAALIGLPPAGRELHLSRVFSTTSGVAKRRRLNAEIVEARARLAEAFAGEAAERQDARLALLVLGRDPLVGTVALSLHEHLLATGDGPLSAAPLPAVPTRTGLPFVHREVLADAEVGGCPVRAGEAVAVALHSFEGMPDAARQRFFGAGPHLCLGRPLSLALMERIAAELGGIGTRIRVKEFLLRRDDVVAVPERFLIEVLA